MSVYERRLAADKAEIRQRVSKVGERVGEAVAHSVDALLRRDEAECSRIILGDLPINREIRAIDKLCHAFVARHLPSAGHLRFVSSVLQMNVALERVGDYAVTISREAVQLRTEPPVPVAENMRSLSDRACEALQRALLAFATTDPELARGTKPLARDLERTSGRMFRELLEQSSSLSTAESFALLTVFHRLSRVADQAKNVCEETLFELTGETKPPKRYKILFLAARDTLVAPLAVALARKAFPESGEYHSAGYAAGDKLAPELKKLGQDLGLDVGDLEPTQLESTLEALEDFHVIVCLSTEARKRLALVPYATTVLVWTPPLLPDSPEEPLSPKLREISQYLGAEIRELMVTMRGDDAS